MAKKIAQQNIDQGLIDLIGRVPASIILGGITGAITELGIRIARYDFSFDGMDVMWTYLRPYFSSIAFCGALGGLAVGLFVSLATARLERIILRALVGAVVGIVARAL